MPPSITTDTTDYSAGDTAFITGDHWNPGDVVALRISEDGNPGHVDTLYVTADDAGGVFAQYVVPGHGTAQNFTLTATGASPEASANTVFSNAFWPGSFSWDTSGWTTAAPSSSPWVRTNQDDYQPGSYALIAGGGWTPGDVIAFAVSEIGSNGLQPAEYLHAVADEAGGVFGALVLQSDNLRKSYELVAVSGTDPAAVARTTFSDSGFNFHTCALTTNGDPKCWGKNSSGQLGDNTTTQRLLPVAVSSLSGVVEISTGAEHTCAVTIAGGVKCWGSNVNGQIGDGTTTQRNAPVDVTGLTSGASYVAAGQFHTCAVTTAGGVKCWGLNGNGQLGNGTTTQQTTAVNVVGLSSGVVQVRTGGWHSCALTTGGGVKCWGWNVFGQLGNGTTLDSSVPVDVSGLTSGVAQIATGGDHTCALTTSGGVKCWGNGSHGQLGDGNTNLQQPTSVDVSGLTTGATQVATGSFHSCALTTASGVKCWGDNTSGRLGDGTQIQRNTPVNVLVGGGSTLTGAAQVYTGGEHSCALVTGGAMRCWGFNGFGGIGDSTTAVRTVSVAVLSLGTGIAVPEVRATTYTLTYAAGAHGTISGVSPQVVFAGQSGSAVTAVGDAGYHFASWSDGFPTAARTDSSVNADHSVTATFAPDTVTLTYTAGAHGTISGTTPQIVPLGGAGTTVTAVPDLGYHFVAWSDGGLTEARTDSNVNADLSVSASFAINTYALTYTAGANGSLSGATSQTVDHGADGTAVTAVANGGYHFTQWSDGSTANPRTDTGVTAAIAVTASFAINQYSVAYSAGAHGSISGAAAQMVNHGADATSVTAVAETGYHFTQWSDGSTANPRSDTNVTAAIAVTASFAINQYSVVYLAGAHGVIAGPAAQNVDHGADAAAVTAVADTGYHFVQWSDGSAANPRTDKHVTGPIALSASFAINQYTLTYTAGANGSIAGAASQIVDYGGSGTAVTATPNDGYKFVQWSDGSTANPRTDASVKANLAVSATFAELPYVVTGFFAPIDMPQPNVVVWNSAQAGQTVPVKWRLTKNGANVSDPNSFLTSPGGLFSYPIDCSSHDGDIDLAIEEYAPGDSSLVYRGDGMWQYNWQTLKAYKGTCRVMFVKFRDGTASQPATFKFK